MLFGDEDFREDVTEYATALLESGLTFGFGFRPAQPQRPASNVESFKRPAI
jgi:hypothetical protein